MRVHKLYARQCVALLWNGKYPPENLICAGESFVILLMWKLHVDTDSLAVNTARRCFLWHFNILTNCQSCCFSTDCSDINFQLCCMHYECVYIRFIYSFYTITAGDTHHFQRLLNYWTTMLKFFIFQLLLLWFEIDDFAVVYYKFTR